MTLSKREKILIVILIFMIVFYFYYTQLYLKQLITINELTTELSALPYQSSDNDIAIENIGQALQEEKASISEQGILFTDEQYKIINMLNTILNDTGVSLISMEFVDVENTDNIEMMRNVCIVEGSKQNIDLFIKTVENIKYKSKIFSCNIENKAEGGMECSMTLDFFMI